MTGWSSQGCSSRWIRARRRAGLAVLGLALALPCAAAADTPEAALQAEFVSKFVRFVSWPEGAFPAERSPISVGVLGDAPDAWALANFLAKADAGGRGFTVKPIASLDEATDHHIVIVAETSRSKLRRLARQLEKTAVLSVAASLDFAKDGGVLGLEMYKGKVAFEVNNETARRADLKINSRVLRIATNVY